jgi:hypothetical protein
MLPSAATAATKYSSLAEVARCQLSALSARLPNISATSRSKTSLQNSKKSRIKTLGSFGAFAPNEWPLRGSSSFAISHLRFLIFHFAREWKMEIGKWKILHEFGGHIQKFASTIFCRSDWLSAYPSDCADSTDSIGTNNRRNPFGGVFLALMHRSPLLWPMRGRPLASGLE